MYIGAVRNYFFIAVVSPSLLKGADHGGWLVCVTCAGKSELALITQSVMIRRFPFDLIEVFVERTYSTV